MNFDKESQRVNLWDIGVYGREARAMVKLNVLSK